MLKSVIEDQYLWLPGPLGERGRRQTFFADNDRSAWTPPRQHERFIAGALDRGKRASRKVHDLRTTRRAAVPARQNGNPAPAANQTLGEREGKRRLTAAAAGKVADGDHGRVAVNALRPSRRPHR
jgi:hypothetical protein